MTHKIIIFLCLILLESSCAYRLTKETTNETGANCNILKGYFSRNNYCDRLMYIEKRYYCLESLKCLKLVTDDLADTTGINANVTGTWAGIDYESDSLFFEDIKKWKAYFKCPQ